MSELAAPPPPNTRKRRSRVQWQTIWAVMAGVLIAGTAGWYFVRLFSPPVPPKAGAKAQPPKPPAAGATSGSTLLSTGMAPASAQPQPAPRAAAPLQTAMQRVVQAAALQRTQPAGLLYDPASSNIALSFLPLELSDPQVAEAQKVLEDYVKATTVEARLQHVFLPGEVAPHMREHYEKRGATDPGQGELRGAGIIKAGASEVVSLQFAAAARPDTGLRANFHRTRAGRLRLDWEAWTAWCEMTWPDFKKERSQRQVLMRAVASESSYYNHEFSEKWRWLAVRLRSADGLHSVTGYVRRDSMAGIAIANLIGVPVPNSLPAETPLPPLNLPGTQSVVTVRLAFPPNAQSDHCVEIISLLADRWLLFPGEMK
ncbi:MAG: hypothetical protein ACO1TE_28180 [Prosthecobacter sp.]